MANPTPVGSAPAFTGSVIEPVSVPVVYRAYAAFHRLAGAMGRGNLAHQLVLCEPLSVSGEAPLIAASIALAGSLTIEPVAAAVRHGTRSGAIDFDVNNLDEALRALKNELRKGLSIAICLEGQPASVLAEMAERGVQPDAICVSGDSVPANLTPFLGRGARLLDPLAPTVEGGRVDTYWRVASLPGTWLPRLDELAASILPPEDTLRRQWLKRAPRYVGRPLRTEHYLPLSGDEYARFLSTLRATAKAEGWGLPILLKHNGEQEEIHT